ncbi:alpha-amylase family glycosyl hydrolase [Granulicatella seriolae]|uniref:Alpha-amylase family glycosyl hydrolase n=1 Tax=Granulicatella seriolae TaxID=2967226 RepID=A0ABT1WQD3_9LACT|nr:alpha-amylase family glycosyl hydrolase [Granulicatella seriolae]
MTVQTDTALRKELIYSIFIRNFSPEGTFKGVIPQLDRIKALGTDIIWFLPFYPIGEKNRKGQAGSPYAIKDYRAVDPNYGTMEDFKNLCNEIHKRGMKVMIDIVYNHTSPDSVLVETHPEWFFKKADGSMGNQVGDWTDIVDLDYKQAGLWEYQIETLKQWAKLVDGFRCDVAPLVPVDFWVKARQAVEEVKPGIIWLSETVHLSFIRELRSLGVLAHSDSEIYQAFDMTYDYDVRDLFDAYLKDEIPLSTYVNRLDIQEAIFPANYVKLRNIENHDNPRAKALIPNEESLLQWTSFIYLQKGATLLYNGQEVQEDHVPTLFDDDKINWSAGRNISQELVTLAKIQKEDIPMDAAYSVTAVDDLDTAILTYKEADQSFIGICSFKNKFGKVSVPVLDGTYINLINGKEVTVKDGQVETESISIAFKAPNK